MAETVFCDIREKTTNRRIVHAIKGIFAKDVDWCYAILHAPTDDRFRKVSCSDCPLPGTMQVTCRQWLLQATGLDAEDREQGVSDAASALHAWLDNTAGVDCPDAIQAVIRRIKARIDYKPGFYLVWGEGTKQVTFRHDTHQSAIEEAKRLADMNVGQRFYVVGATEYAVAARTVVYSVSSDSPDTPVQDIPF